MKMLLACIWLLILGCHLPAPAIRSDDCSAPALAEYVLPYPVGVSYYLLQGNCGSFSHKAHFRHAYDFRMPVGSYITPARAGVVKRLEERFEDGNGKDAELNYILLLHDDSTVARYMHLTVNGVLVELNQRVNAGDTIGLSGHTGISTEPHLHLDIIGACRQGPCQTLPFAFENSIDSRPVSGRTYRAISY